MTGPRGFDQDEQAAIEAALRAGRLRRIENGDWPDVERLNRYRRLDFRARRTAPVRRHTGAGPAP